VIDWETKEQPEGSPISEDEDGFLRAARLTDRQSSLPEWWHAE